MTDEVPRNPPDLAVAHAEQGARAALASQINVSSAGVLVAEAMLGMRPFTLNHVAAMARHNYDLDSTNGLLLGGAEGQEWARAALTRTAAPTTPIVDLADLSAKLNEADRLFREKLEAVLSQAMKTAARRAYKKAGARLANPRRCNASDRERYNKEWRAGRISAAMLAATDTTPNELLDESFDDAADQTQILYQERQDRKRKALLAALAALGLTAATLDTQWDHVEDLRGSSIASYLVTALFNEARARFDAGTPFSTSGPGEIPRDVDVPTRIVADVELIADGATLDPNSQVTTADQGTGDASAVLTDYTDDLVQQVMEQYVPGLTTTYGWNVGDPARPFEPHQDLAGEEATNETYFIVFAKDPGDFPEGNTYWLPGDHIGCFPAGTSVSGPLAVGATLRWYEGEMVELAFASGDLLTATPNHPVLTERGWVPAGSLDELDRVVRCEGRDRIAKLVPDDQQMPALIEQVVGSLGEHPGVVAARMPVAPEHFHGDGVGSEVAVVWTNGLLRDGVDSSLGEPPREQGLGRRDARLPSFPSESSSAPSLERVGTSPLGSVGRLGEPPVLLGRPTGSGPSVGLRPTPDADPLLKEPARDHGPSDAVLERQALDGLASLDVAVDELIHVRRLPFAGHVYNLHTALGWYIANGVIVHNCQCYLTTVYGQGDAADVDVDVDSEDIGS